VSDADGKRCDNSNYLLSVRPPRSLSALAGFNEEWTPEQLKGEGDGDFNIQKRSERIEQRPEN
jgi:hypothetical protein